ncbi:MAG: response regulator [Nitrospirae bacterium]|nr:response regulator [Nitrospirota bacterium]
MKKVLVIDDEADMAAALKESLKRFGFDPMVYHDAADALSELNLNDFSLIVTDMKMPKMSGLEFLKEVRDRNIFVPVIVVTGYGTVENAVDAMKLGATDYIIKPFSFEVLRKVIERLLPSGDSDIVAESAAMKNIMSVMKEGKRRGCHEAGGNRLHHQTVFLRGAQEGYRAPAPVRRQRYRR